MFNLKLWIVKVESKIASYLIFVILIFKKNYFIIIIFYFVILFYINKLL
jgi:hypothetical protein